MSDVATKLTTIAENQQKVYDSGYAKGQAEGGNTEELEQAYWDAIQICGNKTNYSYCFSGKYWTNELFKPKYAFIQTNCNYAGAFSNSMVADLSQYSFIGTTFNAMFAGAIALKKVGTIKVNALSCSLQHMFNKCSALQEIALLSLYPANKNNNSITFVNAFDGCTALKEVRFEGLICNNISFVSCQNLSMDSVDDIISHLYTATASRTLTLHSAVGSQLTDEQKAAISAKKWTLSY